MHGGTHALPVLTGLRLETRRRDAATPRFLFAFHIYRCHDAFLGSTGVSFVRSRTSTLAAPPAAVRRHPHIGHPCIASDLPIVLHHRVDV